MDLQNNQGIKRLLIILYILSPVVWMVLTDIEDWHLFTHYPYDLGTILGGLLDILVVLLIPIGSIFVVSKILFWVGEGFKKGYDV